MADREDPLLVRWQYGLAAPVCHQRRQEPLGRQLGAMAGLRQAVGQHFPGSAAACAGERNHGRFRTVRARNWWWTTGSRAMSRIPPGRRIFSCWARRVPCALGRWGKVAAGHYRGRLGIGQNQGLFRVRPLVDSRAFPEVGFYRQEDEMREYGNNLPLLRQIAASTGGRFGVKPGEAFDAAGRSIPAEYGIVAWPAGVGARAESARTGDAQVERPAGSAAPGPGGSGVRRRHGAKRPPGCPGPTGPRCRSQDGVLTAARGSCTI